MLLYVLHILCITRHLGQLKQVLDCSGNFHPAFCMHPRTAHKIMNPASMVYTDFKLTWWWCRQCSKWRPLPRTACLRLLILVTSATSTPWPGRSVASHWLRQFKLDLPRSDWSAQILLTIAAPPNKTHGLQTVWTELVLQNGRTVRLKDL